MELLNRIAAIFTETIIPYAQNLLTETDRSIYAGAEEASRVYHAMMYKGGESNNPWWIIFLLGLLLAALLFAASDLFDGVKINLAAGLIGDRLFGSHRGVLQLLIMVSLVNLMRAFYEPIQSLINLGLFHAETNSLENSFASSFNPLGVMVLTLIVMHGFMDAAGKAGLFAVCAVLFPYTFSAESHTGNEWALIAIGAFIGAMVAGACSQMRHVYAGYLALGIWSLCMQMIYVESILQMQNNTGWVQELLDILYIFRAEIVATAAIWVLWFILERFVVGSARDIEIALEKEEKKFAFLTWDD